jgi:hypothetical protein
MNVVQASVELEHKACRSLLSATEIKHAWSFTSTLPSLDMALKCKAGVILTDSGWLLSTTLREELMEHHV